MSSNRVVVHCSGGGQDSPIDFLCILKMPQGIFIGLTEAELLAIKAKALTELTTGLVTTSYSDSGTSVGKAITMPAKERMAEAMYALQLLNPTTYGERITVIRTDWSNTKD